MLSLASITALPLVRPGIEAMLSLEFGIHYLYTNLIFAGRTRACIRTLL